MLFNSAIQCIKPIEKIVLFFQWFEKQTGQERFLVLPCLTDCYIEP